MNGVDNFARLGVLWVDASPLMLPKRKGLVLKIEQQKNTDEMDSSSKCIFVLHVRKVCLYNFYKFTYLFHIYNSFMLCPQLAAMLNTPKHIINNNNFIRSFTFIVVVVVVVVANLRPFLPQPSTASHGILSSCSNCSPIPTCTLGGVERGTVRVTCLAHEKNAVTSDRAPTH